LDGYLLHGIKPGEKLDKEARADGKLNSTPKKKTTRGFGYLFVFYWWIPIAIISFVLMLSILAGVGWYTRDKSHDQIETKINEDSDKKEETTQKS
jgi:hypothetical protein